MAGRLFETAARPTALIEQDHYRFAFNVRAGEDYSKAVRQLVGDAVLTSLGHGFDVILEGILSAKGYREVLARVIREHPTDNRLFYFDIGLDETLRRHRTRKTAGLFSEADMRSWYRPGDVLGWECERVIGEASTLGETLALIRGQR